MDLASDTLGDPKKQTLEEYMQKSKCLSQEKQYERK